MKMNREKRNYLLGVLHGVFYFAANGFADTTTVLPAFLRHLVSSSAIIGFVAAISRGGALFFQLVSAAYLEGKPKKRVLVASLYVRFFSWAFIAVSSGILLPDHPTAELVLFIVFLSTFSFAGGVAVIPFYDIITHNIPAGRLGRFWATRQFVGGILAVASGLCVKLIMQRFDFPMNYTVIFSLATIVFAAAFVSLGSMDEGGVNQKPNRSVGDFLKGAVDILKNRNDFRFMLLSEFLSHAIYMCLPFIAIYALYRLGLPRDTLGYFVSAQMAGSIVSNLFWGYYADRKGSRFVIIATNLLAVSVPALVMFVKSTTMFLIVFFLMGAYLHGSFIGYTNYMLKIAPEAKRPTFVSIRGTFNAISYFLPAAGGLLVDSFSYETLFSVTTVASLCGLVFATLLKEPVRS